MKLLNYRHLRRKSIYLLLFLVLMTSCHKRPQIIINNINNNDFYKNIDSIDFIPNKFVEKFPQISISFFDVVKLSERKDLVKLNGYISSYLLHHIFAFSEGILRESTGDEDRHYNKDWYLKNTELYACGKIEVEKGITTLLVLEISTDEIFKIKVKRLYFFNVENNKLCSIVEISNYFFAIDSEHHLNGLRDRNLFYLSDFEIREDSLYQYMPKEIRSILRLQKGLVKILNYSRFEINKKGRVICL